VDGTATEEARRALARVIGVAPSRVSVHSGNRAHLKVFAVSAADPHVVSAALETAAGNPALRRRHPSGHWLLRDVRGTRTHVGCFLLVMLRPREASLLRASPELTPS
jgi:hypothetical protein